VARNRKRSKDRRAQRPQRPPGSRPGVATARSNGRDEREPATPETPDTLDASTDALDASTDHAHELPDFPAADEPESPTAGEPQAPTVGEPESPGAEAAEQPAFPVTDEPEFSRADDDADEEAFELPDDVPGSLEHATPDVELADAQIALGAREASVPARRASAGRGAPHDEDAEDDDELESAGAAKTVGAPRANAVRRLISFLQGSWRELQRVQWPDRRQVMQATGVVIGFVVVAGVYLGVADYLAGKLVDFILK
jgi:preprotein translocase subunit SecE